MSGKILIVTAPDYYHGEVPKHLLINPTADEKNAAQEWLKAHDVDMTLYLYNNNKEIQWLLNVAAMVDTIYFNVDNTSDISYHYSSYLISNPQVTYKCVSLDFSPINKDKVYNINEYIQRYWMG